MLQPPSVWLQAKKPRGTAGLVSPAPAPTCSAPRALAAIGDSPEAIAAPYAALPHAVRLASPAVARNAPRLPGVAVLILPHRERTHMRVLPPSLVQVRAKDKVGD